MGGWLVFCGCMMILGSGGSTFQEDTGYRIGGMKVTREQNVPASCGGFLMGLMLIACGMMMVKAGV